MYYSPFYAKNVNMVNAMNTGEMTIELTLHALALIPYALNYKVKCVNINLIS